MFNLEEFLYFVLLMVNIPLIYYGYKAKLLFKSPLFLMYFYSVFIFNVIGSCVVFFPDLLIYGQHNYFSYDFFYILFFQSLSFYLFLPFHRNKTSKEHPVVIKLSIKRYVVILFILSLFIILLFLLKYGLPPILTVDFSIGNNLLVKERTLFFESIGSFWLHQLGFYTMPQFLTIIIYLLYKTKNSNLNKVLFYSMFLFSTALSLSFLHKTPLVLFLFQLFIAKALFEREIKIKMIIISTIVIFIAILSWYILSLSGNTLVDGSFIYKSIFNRLFGVYSLSLAIVPNLVDTHGLYYGATLINPFGLFSFEQVNLSKEIHMFLFGFEGDAPAPAIGYAYADFGWMGVFIFIIGSNVLILMYQYILNSIKNRIISTVLLSYLLLKIMFISMTSIFDTLLNPKELFILLTLVGLYYMQNLKRGKI